MSDRNHRICKQALIRQSKSLLLFISLFASGLLGCSLEQEISINNAVIKKPLTGRTTTAAYFELNNGTTEQLTLVSASSDFSGNIEFHTTVKQPQNMSMHMQRMLKVDVPAQSTLVFEPGAHHLMVFETKFLDKKSISIRFRFSDGSVFVQDFSVEGY